MLRANIAVARFIGPVITAYLTVFSFFPVAAAGGTIAAWVPVARAGAAVVAFVYILIGTAQAVARNIPVAHAGAA